MVLPGCVPISPSEQQLVGRWQVTWQCGTEGLDLRADSTYGQSIDYAVGGHATHTGKWKITPRESHLEGANVVLQDAMEFCTTFGEKLPEPERGDRRLQTVWEWGRSILEFNPDVQGFERQ